MSAEETAATLQWLLTTGAPRSPNLDSLNAWGRAVGKALVAPGVIALEGDLGAGKTTLARAICAGLGVENLQAVTSPTFSLIQEYQSADGRVFHIDLYRLKGPAEVEALGWDELLSQKAILLVEWPDRAGDLFPDNAIFMNLDFDPEHHERRLLRVSTRDRERWKKPAGEDGAASLNHSARSDGPLGQI